MAIFVIIIILAVVIFFIAQNYNPGSARYRVFSEALGSYRSQLFNEAIKKFLVLLNDDPYNAMYHWYIALCSIHRREYTNAIYHFDHVLQIKNYSLPEKNLPDTEKFNELGVHHKLMEIYEALNLKDKLVEQYNTLMKLDPDNEQYPLSIAQQMIDNKDYSENVQTYLEQTLSINSKNVRAQFLLALVYYKRNELDKALQSAEKTITMDKSISDAYYIMGIARYRLNLKEEAERHFRDATLCDYFRKSTAFYLAKLMISSGKNDLALPYARDANKFALSRHEDPAMELEAKYLYATLLEQGDYFMEALEQYQQIQNIQPEFQDVAKRIKYMAPVHENHQQKNQDADLIELFKKMKITDCADHSESILKNMGYKVKKVNLIDDKSINMVVQKKDDDSGRLTGVFIRRGIGIIQEDTIKNLERFMSGMQVPTALLITPNDFNPASRKYAEKKAIKTINGNELYALLKTVMK